MKYPIVVVILLVGVCSAQPPRYDQDARLSQEARFAAAQEARFKAAEDARFKAIEEQRLKDARYTAARLANEVVITRTENDNSGDGTFRWLSELSDGSRHEQSGYVKAGVDPEHPIQVIQGVISYISPEGQQIDLQYIADENGFQPQGAHLPALPRIEQKFLEQQRLREEEDKRIRLDQERKSLEEEQLKRYDEELRLYEQARRLGQYRPRPSPPPGLIPRVN